MDVNFNYFSNLKFVHETPQLNSSFSNFVDIYYTAVGAATLSTLIQLCRN